MNIQYLEEWIYLLIAKPHFCPPVALLLAAICTDRYKTVMKRGEEHRETKGKTKRGGYTLNKYERWAVEITVFSFSVFVLRLCPQPLLSQSHTSSTLLSSPSSPLHPDSSKAKQSPPPLFSNALSSPTLNWHHLKTHG